MLFFFFNDTATTEIYTLSLHDALPICRPLGRQPDEQPADLRVRRLAGHDEHERVARLGPGQVLAPAELEQDIDRKSTRLNSSHANISYAVFCLKKKKELQNEEKTR